MLFYIPHPPPPECSFIFTFGSRSFLLSFTLFFDVTANTPRVCPEHFGTNCHTPKAFSSCHRTSFGGWWSLPADVWCRQRMKHKGEYNKKKLDAATPLKTEEAPRQKSSEMGRHGPSSPSASCFSSAHNKQQLKTESNVDARPRFVILRVMDQVNHKHCNCAKFRFV